MTGYEIHDQIMNKLQLMAIAQQVKSSEVDYIETFKLFVLLLIILIIMLFGEGESYS